MNIWAVLYTLLGQSYNDLNGKTKKNQLWSDIKKTDFFIMFLLFLVLNNRKSPYPISRLTDKEPPLIKIVF